MKQGGALRIRATDGKGTPGHMSKSGLGGTTILRLPLIRISPVELTEVALAFS